jgi:HPt (histidine-containing phosphotransfer) domain-containing protein
MNQTLSDETPIDRKLLREIMDDDDDLLYECLEDFMRDYPAMLERIRQAIEANSCAALEESAHSFKGSLKYIAAIPASEKALQLETMGRANNFEGANSVYSSLVKECERIKGFIDNV